MVRVRWRALILFKPHVQLKTSFPVRQCSYIFKLVFQEVNIAPRAHGTNGRRSFARFATLTLCVLHEDSRQCRRRLPAFPRHKVLKSRTREPSAFCLCVGVDCRRRRQPRPVRPREGLPTAPATVPCAP